VQSELTGVKSRLADSSREVQRLDGELSAARADVTNLKSRVSDLIAQVPAVLQTNPTRLCQRSCSRNPTRF
jgi:hypothetical protein